MCAVANAGELDDICAAVKAAGIDTTMGLSDKEKREYMGRLPSALNVNFSDLKDGPVEAHMSKELVTYSAHGIQVGDIIFAKCETFPIPFLGG